MRPRQARRTPSHRTTDNVHWARRVGECLSLPFTLASAPTVGFLVGWFLDRKIGTFPWLTIALLVLGFIGGVREVWRSVSRSESDERRT